MPKSRQPYLDPTVLVRSFGVTLSNMALIPPHAPGWHELIYASQGVLTVRTDQAAWVLPPHRAVWIPQGVNHRLEITGTVALRNLYVRADLRASGRALPQDCCVVNVTGLLREVLLRIIEWSVLDTRKPEQRRLIGVLLDELKLLRTMPLQLPAPTDPRAVRFAALAASAAAEGSPLPKLLRACGASRRTMERLFHEETGMSLGQWLRRQKLLHSLKLLAAGHGVQNIAEELGYQSTSAFIAMFRRELGQTPGRYFEQM
ncbi:helix-turn-helix transcriptional regulator [uncultured Paludibaculum sp.]|uniref:AraC family transcriptional regulator n=1 Tax=uncultured Paludibaculum sp. TaxID=1765020 RepID=UPI002AAAE95C|nr:helix-turn-helix transcriptional regulator [uncultured Paludibaculum sp.]